uniref:Uncharacterized protein n=1 Tax=Plectus sambesii TaxID=2011161 RepID=A0A914UVP3_9BILA
MCGGMREAASGRQSRSRPLMAAEAAGGGGDGRQNRPLMDSRQANSARCKNPGPKTHAHNATMRRAPLWPPPPPQPPMPSPPRVWQRAGKTHDDRPSGREQQRRRTQWPPTGRTQRAHLARPTDSDRGRFPPTTTRRKQIAADGDGEKSRAGLALWARPTDRRGRERPVCTAHKKAECAQRRQGVDHRVVSPVDANKGAYEHIEPTTPRTAPSIASARYPAAAAAASYSLAAAVAALVKTKRSSKQLSEVFARDRQRRNHSGPPG